ncbi:dihydrofolate reductase family protein [Nonomuraea rubra]|uniref:Dihydrofolate reductase n=1 Tax=Nonomuraea rubra TaxID=46180 RepID=A0A7X0NXZ6_9ACTN|nr:dihydrofolate reductase family protein [Nonomuraea rubra]MBB6551617.1 dihydrofolate reductase [Nonomuraea rubra]
MSKVILDVSVSLDGFTAGPDVRPEEPMGDGGERLHEWMGNASPVDQDMRRQVDAAVGAVVIGRHTFDLGLRPWGGTPWPGVPSFVVTHRTREDLLGDNGGTFAFDGLEAAVRRAREAAGDKHVIVMGADVARQLLRAGLLDEIWLHIAPVLLGGGTRLFDGEQVELVPVEAVAGGAFVPHVRYRVRNA